jgi:hypothetical protein
MVASQNERRLPAVPRRRKRRSGAGTRELLLARPKRFCGGRSGAPGENGEFGRLISMVRLRKTRVGR